ncbi:chemotaxis protein methyltransferase CheR [Massilia sp. UYP32]|uniref:CheR family methyltransferase n=1 Tax=Massilia TaxID=149698 RepID=UPI000D8DB9D0|nr:CheR family methyltransferase [Massilia sp. NP310]QYG03264.1 chemotaxis protein [Massilia sp. NP310]
MNALTGVPVDTGLAELEIDLLLEALYQRFGLDYRSHERAILRRRLQELARLHALPNLTRLQEQVLHAPGAALGVVRALAVPPAALFDRPDWARRQRGALADSLRPTALPKVWLPEVGGVGEAWTLAVLLAEEKLYGRTEVFATLASDELLFEAREATLPASQLADAQRGYEASGGTGRLADYFEVSDGRARLLPRLRERITWLQYCLVTDGSFNEFHAIVCCRALPDFGPVLRQRVLRLFRDSLALFGVLGIDRELAASEAGAADYQPLFDDGAWYKRVR